jgi:pimeloyl-ACP methyl ester carboxylesterase
VKGWSARCIAVAALCAACASAPPFDPVAMDPPPDAAFPALLAEGTTFTSDGARLNAILYAAAGAGPHPTLMLLHGFPGNERNLDLAHAMRRAGWNVVFFNYRGTWGSGGSFSFQHVLEDVGAVLDQLREREFAEAYRVDPDRIAIVGHSMGGFAALMTGSERREVACVGSLAGANLGAVGASLADPAAAQRTALAFGRMANGPIAGLRGDALVSELRANSERFDLVARAPALAAKPVLLIAGSRDVVARPELNHAPLVAAIAAQPGARLRQTLIDDDHAFSGSRIALAHALHEFLSQDCLGASR